MQVVRTRAELRGVLASAPRPIGLVPTMGWLHAGHVSLVERARAESATVVMSIFVNPTQFGQAGDFERYPRDEQRDLAKAEAAGVDIVFAPGVEAVYPAGFDTTVSVGAIARPLEGAARPGHFEGVATVVAILFALVGAERAYFGLKDYQQVRVITRMALDLALPTEVIPCDTVREADGLAMSSRNARLTPEGRAAAPVLRRALLAGAGCVRSGEASAAAVRDAMLAVLATEPAATPDYVSVADPDTLDELAAVSGRALLSLAVRIDDVRLIDNERVL
ncbi:MAG TPA: pantoate--beta-alanine ligase [Candidatus Limnocylindrales bacterium]|nr:pantoate--beta-alanine ligase [Candidatus Limnocylindrales bacterium]